MNNDWDILAPFHHHFIDKGYTADTSTYIMSLLPARKLSILALGGGSGQTLFPLKTNTFEVVVIDASKHMVEICRTNGFDARLGLAQQLPLDDQTFDVIITLTGIIDYMEDETAREVLRECHRVARQDALIFVGHLPRDDWRLALMIRYFGKMSYWRLVASLDRISQLSPAANNWVRRIFPYHPILEMVHQLRQESAQANIPFKRILRALPGSNHARKKIDIETLLLSTGWQQGIHFYEKPDLILASSKKAELSAAKNGNQENTRTMSKE